MRRSSPVDLGRVAAYLPQRSGSVLFNETVRDEIAFTARHRRSIPPPDWLIEMLGIGDLLDRDPRDLSEGQRLRAALAAVLTGEPRVVLLDEPTRGMDGRQKRQLAAVLAELRRQGTCILLATHDVELAAAVADTVILLGHGEIIAHGPPAEVLSGSMSFSTQINRLFGPGYLTLADLDLTNALPIADTSRASNDASTPVLTG